MASRRNPYLQFTMMYPEDLSEEAVDFMDARRRSAGLGVNRDRDGHNY
jgi:hypothetical protein